MYKQFSDLKFTSHPYRDGIAAKEFFDNGFGISVIKSDFSYGGPEGLYEIAVLGPSGHISYDTPITDDVIGHLSEDAVSEIMKQIQDLVAITPDSYASNNNDGN